MHKLEGERKCELQAMRSPRLRTRERISWEGTHVVISFRKDEHAYSRSVALLQWFSNVQRLYVYRFLAFLDVLSWRRNISSRFFSQIRQLLRQVFLRVFFLRVFSPWRPQPLFLFSRIFCLLSRCLPISASKFFSAYFRFLGRACADLCIDGWEKAQYSQWCFLRFAKVDDVSVIHM